MLKALSRSLISAVFPLCCELCGSALPLRGEDGVCGGCERSLRIVPGPHCARCGRPSPCAACAKERFYFDGVLAACHYEGDVKKLLCALKFHRRKSLLPVLVRLLERRLRDLRTGWDGVTAVPMARPHRYERGFNQAVLLARAVSRITGAPFLKNALSVRGAVRQQARLGRREREQNVAGRFRGAPSAAGKKLLLVDDILTTGQTASECARALKEAGALGVDVLVVARGRG